MIRYCSILNLLVRMKSFDFLRANYAECPPGSPPYKPTCQSHAVGKAIVDTLYHDMEDGTSGSVSKNVPGVLKVRSPYIWGSGGTWKIELLMEALKIKMRDGWLKPVIVNDW